jgi:hypothetical protein
VICVHPCYLQSLPGLSPSPGTPKLLQQASGPIHIQTANMTSPGEALNTEILVRHVVRVVWLNSSDLFI